MNIQAVSFNTESFDNAVGEGASGEFANAYRSSMGGDEKAYMESIQEAYALDKVAQRLIESPIYDSLTNWRDIENENLINYDESLEFQKVITETMIKSSFFPTVILPILKNPNGSVVPFNQTLEGVLSRGSVEIEHLCVYSDNVCFSDEIENNIRSNCHGMPKTIQIGNTKVHPSRVILSGFGGISTFHSIKKYLADYHEARRRKEIAVRRNNAFFMTTDLQKVAEFLKANELATGKKYSAEEIVQEKARMAYANLNDHNIMIGNDGDELHNFQTNNITHLIENVDQEMQTLTAVSGIPYAKLWGKSSSSIGNNSQESFENYNNNLKQERSHTARPLLEKLDTFCSQVYKFQYSKKDWTFNPTTAEESRLTLLGEVNDDTD